MKKKRSLILFILFIILASFGYYLTQKKNSLSNANTEDRNFAVKDIESIYKIFLGKKDGENITLQRSGKDWIVNGKYKVFPNTMKYLLETLQNLQVKSIPPKPAYEFIMNDLSSSGIKVEIYNSSNEILKTYYVGGVTEDETGLYCIMNGAVQPYILHLNKAPTNLRVRYDIKEEDWRDRNLFNIHSNDIESVSFSYPYEKSRGFTLATKDQSIQLFDEQQKPIALPNNKSNMIYSYFSEFENCMFESFVNDHRAKDSICAIKPYTSITIKLKNNSELFSLKLYPVPQNSTDAIALDAEFLHQKQFFRFYACRNDGDFILLQLSQVGKIFIDLPELQASLNKN